MFVVSLPHWPLFFIWRGGIACWPLRLQSHQNRAPSESIAAARTSAVFPRVRWSPEISQIEKDDPSVLVTQGGAMAESRTHLSSRNAPSSPAGTVAPSYQCSPSFEPSAAAVIIAGIPIATVASAIAKASIMTIPLDSTSSSRSDRELEKPFCQSTSTARLLQAYFTAKVLVSRLVATIGRAFRSLWRESDMGGEVKCRSVQERSRHHAQAAACVSAMDRQRLRPLPRRGPNRLVRPLRLEALEPGGGGDRRGGRAARIREAAAPRRHSDRR